MRIPPTGVIASWPRPNYVDPTTRGESLVATNITFMILVTIIVSLRFYSRLKIHKRLGLDDVFIGIALVSSLGLGACVILANVRYGWDRHIWDVSLHKLEGAEIIVFAARIVFVFASTFTRISLICFYFRLVRDSGHVGFKHVLYAAMAWQVVTCIAFLSLAVCLCSPVEGFWNVTMAYSGKTKCLDEGILQLVAGLIICVSDLMVTLLPVPIIIRLNIPLRQRIEASILLSVGLIVTFAGIVRTYFGWKALIATYDETWYSYPLWICAAVEVYLAVICACVPALKPMFNPVFRSMRSMAHSVKTSLRQHSRPGFTQTDWNGSPNAAGAKDDGSPETTSSNLSKEGPLNDSLEKMELRRLGWGEWVSDSSAEATPISEKPSSCHDSDHEYIERRVEHQHEHDHVLRDRRSSGTGVGPVFEMNVTSH